MTGIKSDEQPNSKTIALCRQLINCGDRVLDIGNHTGNYAPLFCDLVSPHGHVTVIAPDQLHLLNSQRSLTDRQIEEEIAVFRQDVAAPGNDNLKLGRLDFIRIDARGNEPALLHDLAATLRQSPRLKILCKFSPCSLWTAGFSPIDFLEEMRAYGFHLLVKDEQAWRAGSFDEMMRALKLIPASAVAEFIGSLNRAESDQAISGQAALFLEQQGYHRPFLEDILFVAPDAWRTACTTLGLDQVSNISADTDRKAKWQLRWASIHDQNALLSLFTSAFREFMSPNLWSWKYAKLDRQGVLAHEEGKVIAYYGGMPRALWLHGKELAAVQICDVMVAPEVRGIMTHRGAFALTAETFLRSQTGTDKPYRLAFGFPNGRAARLGEKLGLYARRDTIYETSWSTDPAVRLPAWFKVEPLQPSRYAILDQLWQDMRQSLPDYILPQKDADFFRWRYAEHPLNTYNTYLVSWRWFNKVVGVIVLRDHGADQGVELMDFLGQPNIFELLLKAALDISGRMGRSRVFSWMTTRVIARLPSPSAQVEITGVYIDPPALKELERAEQLHERWWFLGGDTDFK